MAPVGFSLLKRFLRELEDEKFVALNCQTRAGVSTWKIRSRKLNVRIFRFNACLDGHCWRVEPLRKFTGQSW